MPTLSSPALTLSFDAGPELSHMFQRRIPTLLGKSNFRKWHTVIDPILLSNEQARSLISGTWFEPPSPKSPDSPSTTSPSTASSVSPMTSASPDPSQSKFYTFLHAPSLSKASFNSHQTAHREYEQANLTVCRFIRGTLAMNVIPFVRQQTSAKGLHEQLIYLYGERAGIDMVGGPAVFGTMNIAFQSRRLSEPSISRISEEHVTSRSLPTENAEPAPAQNRRITNDPGLNHSTNSRHTTNNASTQDQPKKPILPQTKKKATFKFTNTFPFRRSSKDNTTTTISSSKTIVSPIQTPPASPITASAHYTHTGKPSTRLAPALPSAERSARKPCTSPTNSTSTRPIPICHQTLDFDFSCTPHRDASTPEDAGI